MATIKDVSSRAGVSIATVSRALSHPEKLSKETLEKVLAAIDALNYRPNSFAQSLRTASARSLIVMVPDLANPFFSRVLAGIETEAAAASLSLLVSNTRDDVAAEKECVSFLMAKRVDGVIQLGARPAEALLPGGKTDGLPFVHAIEAVDDTAVPTVTIDNSAAALAITRAVLERTHRQIGVLAGPERSAITEGRLEGIRTALAEAGITLPPGKVVHGRFDLQAGAEMATALLSAAPEITALICMSDDIAIGAMRSARDAGRRLPQDLSVVGFDDIAYSAFTDPPLATVAQPAWEMGRESIRLLIDLIGGNPFPERRHRFGAALRLRESLSVPRTG